MSFELDRFCQSLGLTDTLEWVLCRVEGAATRRSSLGIYVRPVGFYKGGLDGAIYCSIIAKSFLAYIKIMSIFPKVGQVSKVPVWDVTCVKQNYL